MPETAIAPKQTLLQIADTLQQLFAMREEPDVQDAGAIDAEIQRVVSIELAQKVDGIAWFDAHCDSEVAGLQELITEIEHRIGRINRRKATVRQMTKAAMQQLSATLLKGQVHSIGLRAGAEQLQYEPDAHIPEDYCTVTVKMPMGLWNSIKASVELVTEKVVKATVSVDEPAVKQALRNGRQIAGVRLERKDDVLVIR